MKRRYTVWDEFERMQRNMESLFGGIFGVPILESQRPLEAPTGKKLALAPFRRPLCDVYEKGNNLVAELEMPGLNKDDIKVNVEDGYLEISAEKKQEKEDKKKNSYRYERRYAGFQRYIQIPEGVDPKQIKGNYKDGVLRLEIPKPKQIEKKGVQVKIN